MVQAFTQNLAQLDAQKGGKFSLFNGNVSGEFTDLVRCFDLSIDQSSKLAIAPRS